MIKSGNHKYIDTHDFDTVINMLVGGNIEKLNKEITENITIALSKDSNTEEIRNWFKIDN